MPLYNDIKKTNLEKRSESTKRLVWNQKILNIITYVLFSSLLLLDISYLVKENIVGILLFSKVVIIISIILEAIILMFSIIFKNNNKILKIINITIFAIPIIAYIPMIALNDDGNIIFLVLRLVIFALLLFAAIKNFYNKDIKIYKAKQTTYSILAILVLISILLFLITPKSRNAIYEYDKAKSGYVLKDVLKGTAPVSLKDGTVSISDSSLKNVDGELEIPATVSDVSSQAFNGANVDTLYVKSSYIRLAESLNNSNVKTVYLLSDDATITDFDLLDLDSGIVFIVSKDSIDHYRDMYNDSTVFIPKLDEDEFFIMYNSSNLNVEYYKKGYVLESKEDVSTDEYKFIKFIYSTNNEDVLFPLTINSNLVLESIWDRIYNFNLDYNDGQVKTPSNQFDGIKENVKLVMSDGDFILPILEKANYRFDGWYDSDKYNDDNVLEYISLISSSDFRDYNLKAKFSKVYLLDYHTNGGVLPEDEIEEAIEGEPITPLTPTRVGYDFVGWYDNEAFDGEPITSVTKAGTSLYAKWVLKAPEIKLSSDDVMVTYGTNVNVIATATHDLNINPLYTWYRRDNDSFSISSNTLSLEDVIDSGIYYCVISFTYNDIDYEYESLDVKVEIEKASYDMSNVKFSSSDATLNDSGVFEFEYNGEVQRPEIDEKLLPIGNDGIKLSVIYSGSSSYKVGSSGEVVAVFTTTSTNYNIPSSITASYTILQRTIEVEWKNSTFTYDGNQIEMEASVTNLIDDDTIELQIAYNQTPINAGSYYAYIKQISGLASKNYKIASDQNRCDFKILPKTYDISSITVSSETFTYDGYEHTPTYENLPSFIVPSENLKPINKGVYNIVVSIESTDTNYIVTDTKNATIQINPKIVEFSWSNTNLVYNGEVQKPVATVTNAVSGDNVSIIVNNNSRDAATYTAQLTTSNSNYKIQDNYEFKYTIQKYNLVVEWSNLEAIYNGLSQVPLAIATNAISTDNIELTIENVLGTEMKNAGTYNVIAKTSNSNYSISNSTNEFIIDKYDLGSIIWSNTELVYNGEVQKPLATVSSLGDDTIDVTVTVIDGSAINVGTYIAKASFESGSNYTFTSADEISFEIVKATFEVEYEVKTNTVTYDGNGYLPIISETKCYTEDGTLITYEFGSAAINAGTNKVNVTFKASSNYNEVTLEGVVEILKRELSISLDDSDLVYNNEIQNPIVSWSNNILGDDINVTLNMHKVAAGTYQVLPSNYVISGSDASNYEILKNNSFTIKKASFDMSGITYSNTEVTYNGSMQYIQVNIPSSLNNNLTATVTGIKDVTEGTYVTVTFESLSTNYNTPDSVDVLMVLNPKEVEIEFSDLELGFTGTKMTPTYTIVGAYDADSVSATLEISGDAINIGTYTATINAISNSNYILKEASYSCEFEIVKGTYDMSGISFTDQVFEYDGNTHTIKITGTLPTGGDNIQVSVSYNDATVKYVSDGKVMVIASFEGSDNYNDIDDMVAYISISAKEISISWSGVKGIIYDGELHQPIAKATNLISGDECILTLNDANINAGTYNAIVTSLSNDNYKLPSDGTYMISYEIQKAYYDMSPISFDDTSFVYDGTSHQIIITGDLSQIVGIDNISPEIDYYDGTASNVSESGTEVYVVFKTTSTNYYAPESMSAIITITPLEIGVTIVSDVSTTNSFTYDGHEHILTPSYDVSDLIGNDTLELFITDTYKNAGTYNVNVTFSNDNYTMDNVYTLTINQYINWWVGSYDTDLWPAPYDTINDNKIYLETFEGLTVTYLDSDNNELDSFPTTSGSYTMKIYENDSNAIVQGSYSFTLPVNTYLYSSYGRIYYAGDKFGLSGTPQRIGSVTYNSQTYSISLKMNSQASVSFETYHEDIKLTLIFGSGDNQTIKIDDELYNINNNGDYGYLTVTLSSGSHKVTMGDSQVALYYIELTK